MRFCGLTDLFIYSPENMLLIIRNICADLTVSSVFIEDSQIFYDV